MPVFLAPMPRHAKRSLDDRRKAQSIARRAA
jgi:hypothetical protein